MKKFFFYLLGCLWLIFLASCEKSDLTNDLGISNNNNREQALIDSTLGFTVKIQDSTLYFPTAEDALTAMNTLREIPATTRRSWEKSVGFVSAQTKLEDLIDQIKVADQDEWHRLLSQNSSLVKESPDDIYGMKSRIYGFYPFIVNTRGFFVSESYWGRAFDGKLYACHLTDYAGYKTMKGLPFNNDISGSRVRMIQLDFDESDLKSHVHPSYTSTKVNVEMHNYAINNPDKKSIFTMQIINSYAFGSTSSTETTVRYYFEVYYDGFCCDPMEYMYYDESMGGWQEFEEVGERTWRIEVPYPGAFYDLVEDYPNWDDETSYQTTTIVRWYNFVGRADLHTTYQAQKKNMWGNWVNWDGTLVYFRDCIAHFKVGENVTGHSNESIIDILGINDNYIEKVEDGKANDECPICTMTLSEYTSKPTIVFSGCVSGIIYSRFCPVGEYTFSHTY